MIQIQNPGSGKAVPLRNIYCIGRNYVKHAEELGSEVPKSPVVFIKPVSSVIQEGSSIHLPSFSNDVHFETELVLLIGKKGKHIPLEDAMGYIAGAGVGLDLTARDTQNTLKDKGLPWTISKGFDTAACLSRFIPWSDFQDMPSIHFSMELNGEPRQHGDTALMIFSVAHIVSYLSEIFTLDEGDIVFTGTPEGVGRIQPGDSMRIALGDKVTAEFTVGS